MWFYQCFSNFSISFFSFNFNIVFTYHSVFINLIKISHSSPSKFLLRFAKAHSYVFMCYIDLTFCVATNRVKIINAFANGFLCIYFVQYSFISTSTGFDSWKHSTNIPVFIGHITAFPCKCILRIFPTVEFCGRVFVIWCSQCYVCIFHHHLNAKLYKRVVPIVFLSCVFKAFRVDFLLPVCFIYELIIWSYCLFLQPHCMMFGWKSAQLPSF